MPDRDRYLTKSLVHAASLLQAFQSPGEVLRLRDVVERTGYAKGMCFSVAAHAASLRIRGQNRRAALSPDGGDSAAKTISHRLCVAGAGQKQLMRKRTMDMEINGHEWWSWDGKTIWFDLQTPRSQVFWIAGVEMATGRKIRYHVERDWWRVHFNSSRDNTLFAGDCGDPSQVAYSTDGMLINLFRVQPGERIAREKAGEHGEAQLRDGPRRSRAECAHYAGQEMGRHEGVSTDLLN